jgi:hypothetical protein
VLLAVAPPFNLAGFELSLSGPAEAGVHAGHGHEGHDHANLAHHGSGNACLQCLVMGGMSLAGATAIPEPTPHAQPLRPAGRGRASRGIRARREPSAAAVRRRA